MRRLLLPLVALAVLLLGRGRAAADPIVVSFDDLVGQQPVPPGYGGINWPGWTYYGWAQPPYNPHSPPVRIYPTGLITPVGKFTFTRPGQTFLGAWFSVGAGTVEFQLYRDGALVHTSSSVGVTRAPTFLSSGYTGPVDAVRVITTAPGQFTMDDVMYSHGPAVAPEPTSLALLGTGALGLAACAWRRRGRSVST